MINDHLESSLTDSEALILAKKGDEEAFTILYERYVTRIYNYIYYRTGNPLEAEDLTARVFHRALAHIPNYLDKGVPFSAWLYRIAHNLVANWHRDNSRRKEVPLEDNVSNVHQEDFPEVYLEKSQDIDLLLRCIRSLTAERQQLIILKFVERLSNEEVAAIMGKTEGAIKSLYHRTLIVLRERLEKVAK